MTELLAAVSTTGIETMVFGLMTLGATIACGFLALKYIKKGTGRA